MKWHGGILEKALNSGGIPPILLVYGDDSGQVRQLAKKAADATGVDVRDAFNSHRIAISEMRESPNLLFDAVGQISLMGGHRLVQVVGYNADCVAAEKMAFTNQLKELLTLDLHDVTVIIHAPELEAKSALAKAYEKAPNAAALRCYEERPQDIRAWAMKEAKAQGKQFAPQALQLFTESMGNNADITRQELEKLLTFVGTAAEITLDDVQACVANAPAVSAFKLCDAVGLRNKQEVSAQLQQLSQAGEDMGQVFNLVVRHLRRLGQVRSAIEAGQSPDSALKSLAPPVFFGQDLFLRQARSYPPRRLQLAAEKGADTVHLSRSQVLESTDDGHIFQRAILGLSA